MPWESATDIMANTPSAAERGILEIEPGTVVALTSDNTRGRVLRHCGLGFYRVELFNRYSSVVVWHQNDIQPVRDADAEEDGA